MQHGGRQPPWPIHQPQAAVKVSRQRPVLCGSLSRAAVLALTSIGSSFLTVAEARPCPRLCPPRPCPRAGGCIAGLQAALDAPSLVRGLLLMDVPDRKAHMGKRQPWRRALVASVQHALCDTPLGTLFFRALATREVCTAFPSDLSLLASRCEPPRRLGGEPPAAAIGPAAGSCRARSSPGCATE